MSNATPIRYLAEIGALHLLPHLFGHGVIPREREAIVLAGEIGINTILLDEKAARDVAVQHGLRCIGTL